MDGEHQLGLTCVKWRSIAQSQEGQQDPYLLTYSVVQSPSWEANWSATSQETPRISRNLKVHYHTHKRPPPVSILGQPNPVHIPTSHLLEINPNIIHPSIPTSPHWSPSLRFPQQDPIHPPLLAHRRHMPRERKIPHKIKRKKAKWIDHIMQRAWLLIHVLEGKIEGYGGREDGKEDGSSYPMTLIRRENTGNWNRKH